MQNIHLTTKSSRKTLIGMARLLCRRLTEAVTNRVSGREKGREKSVAICRLNVEKCYFRGRKDEKVFCVLIFIGESKVVSYVVRH